MLKLKEIISHAVQIWTWELQLNKKWLPLEASSVFRNKI